MLSATAVEVDAVAAVDAAVVEHVLLLLLHLSSAAVVGIESTEQILERDEISL